MVEMSIGSNMLILAKVDQRIMNPIGDLSKTFTFIIMPKNFSFQQFDNSLCKVN